MTVSGARTVSAPQQDLTVSLWHVVVIGFLCCLILSWPSIKTIWLEGPYKDTDDAMRMVQVRDWMAGQDWYDLRALRLDPPDGVVMHWSRVVDVPVAGLIQLFGVFADQEPAERLARIVFPLALQGLLLLATCLCGRLLAGDSGGTLAVVLTIGSGMSLWQFVPGRIDHHAPQIVLLVFMVYACMCGLDPQRPRMAALAGLFAALSMSIAIENLPFILVLMAIFPLAWVVQGAPMRAALVFMGAGFAASLTLCYALFQSPALWLTNACDALSAVHLRAALAGGAAMVLLAAYDRWRKPGLRARLLATAMVGLLATLPLLLDRQCYLDPFAGLDPLVRKLWLSNVQEARSIPKLLRDDPDSFGTFVAPWALGAIAIAGAAFIEQGLSRARFLALLALTLAGCATAVYMSRSITSVIPLALLGGVWAAMRARQACGKQEILAAIAMILTLLPFSTIAWALATPMADRPKAKKCDEASAFIPLRALPTAGVLTLTDLSPFVLLNTPHNVIAGPYHRNNHGNRLMFDIFMAPPQMAQEMLRAAGLRYVAVCDPAHTFKDLIELAPEGLAATIAGDRPLDWLRPIKADTPLDLYEIVSAP